MEPQRYLVRRFPHIAQLALPRPGVLARIRAETPALADLVGHLLADELRGPAVHRTVAGGEDDQVGRQFAAIAEDNRVFLDAFDADPALELDLAVGHEVARADVDVVARAATQVLEKQTRPVVAEVEHEARLLEPRIEAGVALLHLLVNRNLQRRQPLVR